MRRLMSALGSSPRSLWATLVSALPDGGSLPSEAWEQRHRGLLVLLWLHALVILCWGMFGGSSIVHAVLESIPVAGLALLAAQARLPTRIRAVAVSFGLMTCSALLVHLSGGVIEVHFHFFVMVALISLYQDWKAFLIAIGFVVLHHGVLGVLSPRVVYNHPAAWASPWKWALLHGAFIAASSISSLINWRLSEVMYRREQEAFRERVAAQEALRLRDQFLSVVGHELKTPLTSLTGSIQLIQQRMTKDRSLTERNERSLRVMYEQAERLNQLINSLFDLSRIQNHRLTIDQGIVDVNRVVRRAGDMMELWLERHMLEITTPPGPCLIEGDALRLDQVVQNLLQNAIKYSPFGGIIRVVVEVQNDLVVISVTDQGIGIPKSALPKLFARFYRAPNAADMRIEGMGIGLYVVKEIAMLHGGEVEVESVEGAGSTFRVYLPRGRVRSNRSDAARNMEDRHTPLPVNSVEISQNG